MASLTIEIPDEMLARVAELAASEFRTVELQASWLLREQLDQVAERDRLRDKRVTDAERQRRKRARGRDSERDTSRDSHVTPPSPPSLPSPTPPSNPSTHTPIYMRETELPEVPFCQFPTHGDDAMGRVLDEETPVKGPDLRRAATPAPKPKRGDYSPEFEAFWSLRKWLGSKQEAYVEWKAAGLQRDEDLRGRVMAAVVGQIANKVAAAKAGVFAAEFKHACRWIRKAAWEENLVPIPGQVEAPPSDEANPYHHKPWGPIWTQMGEPATYYGVMNFCAAVAPEANPREAGEVFKIAGFEAAVEYVIERRNAG